MGGGAAGGGIVGRKWTERKQERPMSIKKMERKEAIERVKR